MFNFYRKSSHQRRIEAFMKEASQNAPDFPQIPSDNILKLRASLILEEALETVDAMGLTVYLKNRDSTVLGKNDYDLFKTHEANLEEIADGCADVSVVTIGTLSALGISDGALLKEVDLNNLDKFGDGHSLRDDGKLIKPLWHLPPAIGQILINLPWDIIIKYLIARITKAGNISFAPSPEAIQTLQMNLTLDRDVQIRIGDGKNWGSEDSSFFIRDGVWNLKKGINWDGTTVVPDGRQDAEFPTYPITWRASLCHDMGYYTLNRDKSFPYTRKEVDKVFLQLMLESGFKYAYLYYWGVRKFGGFFLRGGWILAKIREIVNR